MATYQKENNTIKTMNKKRKAGYPPIQTMSNRFSYRRKRTPTIQELDELFNIADEDDEDEE